MIQTGSNLHIIDNSGGYYARCIKILKGFKATYGYIGDFILVSIKRVKLIKEVKKGEIYLGIIVRTRKEFINNDGSYSKFKKNAIILLQRNKKILGSEIIGPISKNLRYKKMFRLLMMCSHNII